MKDVPLEDVPLDNISHELNDVKTAVLAVALTNYKREHKSYGKYEANLSEQLRESGEMITQKPIPFYKKGVKSPAGYVIPTNAQVLVCYHGTQFGKISGAKEVLHGFQMSKSKMKFGNKEVSVHKGFKKEFDASKDSLDLALGEVNVMGKKVQFTGHSLGGAVAQIAALDMVTNSTRGATVEKVTTFGGPRVFSKKAAELYNDNGLGDKTLRVKQNKDPVPRMVPRGVFSHVGKKISLKSSKKGTHSGAVYRNIATKDLKSHNIENARASSTPKSFTELYIKPVMHMTKAAFVIAATPITKITSLIKKNKQQKTSKTDIPKKDNRHKGSEFVRQ